MTQKEIDFLMDIANSLLRFIASARIENEKFITSLQELKASVALKPPSTAESVVLQVNKKVRHKPGGVSELSEKEIKEMVSFYPGVSITNRPRRDGRFQGYVTLKNKKIYVYGYTRGQVGQKIKEIIQSGKYKIKEKNTVNGIPATFDGFWKYYFEKFRQRKVGAETIKNDLNRIKNHLSPALGKMHLKQITPADCQDILDSVAAQKKYRTVEELHSLLSVIFKAAINHGIITKNPLDIVFLEKHERQHGKALSAAEIDALKKKFENTRYMQSFMIMLYTGIRPNELATVRIEGDFVVAVNSKRKTKRVQYKKIPITPMLQPYVKGELYLAPPDSLCRQIKTVLPNHKLYDLRTTFYTKCAECGISDVAKKLFVGHSLGELADSYTDVSDEYLINEAKKLRF